MDGKQTQSICISLQPTLCGKGGSAESAVWDESVWRPEGSGGPRRQCGIYEEEVKGGKIGHRKPYQDHILFGEE